MNATLSDPNFLLYYRDRLYVSSKQPRLARRKANYFFSLLLSIRDHYGGHLPNWAAVWDAGTKGAYCATTKAPCLTIAKVDGYKQPGILVPNPLFADVDGWQVWMRKLKDAASPRQFFQRDPRVFWRGAITPSCNIGNVARLQAVTITENNTCLFDAQCTQCTPPDETKCAGAFEYDPAMLKTTSALLREIPAINETERDATESFVPPEDFSKWQYLLNLPGTSGGSYSRNLNLLWPQGSVVLLWDYPAVEWYYPALQALVTHIPVSYTNAIENVLALNAEPDLELSLIENATLVADTLVCGPCIAKYWRRLIEEMRTRFKHARVLDPVPRTKEVNQYLAAILKQVPCSHVHRRPSAFALSEHVLVGERPENDTPRSSLGRFSSTSRTPRTRFTTEDCLVRNPTPLTALRNVCLDDLLLSREIRSARQEERVPRSLPPVAAHETIISEEPLPLALGLSVLALGPSPTGVLFH